MLFDLKKISADRCDRRQIKNLPSVRLRSYGGRFAFIRALPHSGEGGAGSAERRERSFACFASLRRSFLRIKQILACFAGKVVAVASRSGEIILRVEILLPEFV